MLVKGAPGYACATKVTSRLPPQREMVVIVRAGFTLKPGHPVAVRKDLVQAGYMSGDVFAPDDEERTGVLLRTTDFADFKPRVDLLLRATCWPGEGRRATECTVTWRVGAWSKAAQVFGRRVWTERLADPISAPAPFTSMPLGWETSFGGPGFATNPAGKGSGTPELPCVERPGALVRSKRDRPDPVGFGPVSPAWPPRVGKQGKEYGAAWKKTRAPFFAVDFDWSSFNAAPHDQQLERDLRGDEALVFERMHPDAPAFEARLPGVRPRAFARYVDGHTREAALRLDTLLADVDGGLLFLTWRGHLPVAEDDLTDVRTLLVDVEPVHAPAPEHAWVERVDALEKDPLGMKDAVPEAMRKKLEEVQAAKASAAAPPPQPPGAPPVPPPGAPTDQVFALTRAQTAEAIADKSPEEQAQVYSMLDKLQAKTAEAQAQLAAQPPAAPPSPVDAFTRASDLLASQRALAPTPEDAARIDDAMGQLAQAKQAHAAADAQLRETLASSRSGVALPPSPALTGVAPVGDLPAPPAAAPGPRAMLTGRDFAGQDLSGKDLQGAILRGANLSKAKLAGANLKQADLSGASLEGADLTAADLTQTNLTDVRAAGAVFTRATLARTIFSATGLEGAAFGEARADMAVFLKTDAARAFFRAAQLHKVFFSGGRLEGADFSEAQLDTCVFSDVAAGGATFERSTLKTVSFLRSALRGASWAGARGTGCSWQGAKLETAVFRGAELVRAHFPGATMTGADLAEASLVGARFYRARLQRASFARADLRSADLSKVELGQTSFEASNLYDAKFFGAKASAPCAFAGANTKEARWEHG